MANLLIFETEIGGRAVVFGGFSTHGWVTALSDEDRSNDSFDSEQQIHEKVVQGSNGSFIFNLTDNLRFDEVTKITASDYYTKAFLVESSFHDDSVDSGDSGSEKSEPKSQVVGTLKFGTSALIIKDDFRRVTSDLSSEVSFTLNGDPVHRGKVRNLIEPIRTYRPTKMEIWVFRNYSDIIHEASFSSLSGAELEENSPLPSVT